MKLPWALTNYLISWEAVSCSALHVLCKTCSIFAFTRSHSWTLSLARWIHSTHSLSSFLRSIFTSSSCVSLDVPSGPFSLGQKPIRIKREESWLHIKAYFSEWQNINSFTRDSNTYLERRECENRNISPRRQVLSSPKTWSVNFWDIITSEFHCHINIGKIHNFHFR